MSSRECGKCKSKPTLPCRLCEQDLCRRCLPTHDVSHCRDCRLLLCFNTCKSSEHHIKCKGCQQYSCKVSPNVNFCSPCFWSNTPCTLCKRSCNTKPITCRRCGKYVCSSCKNSKLFYWCHKLCIRCKVDDLQTETHQLQNIKRDYLHINIKHSHPVIRDYLRLYISP